MNRLPAVVARVRAEKQDRELREIFSPHPPWDEEGEWNLGVLTDEQLAQALAYVTKLTGTKLPPKKEAPPVKPRKPRPEPRKQRPPSAPPKARGVQNGRDVRPERASPPQPRPSLVVIPGGKAKPHRVRLSDLTGREWLNEASRRQLNSVIRREL